jgi:hypothetical protein
MNKSVLPTSVLSPTTVKALINRYVKDPIKFFGGEYNVINWLDEIGQQLQMINLTDLNRLYLIHICLKVEVHEWYKKQKDHFTSWSTFVSEITKLYTSHQPRWIMPEAVFHGFPAETLRKLDFSGQNMPGTHSPYWAASFVSFLLVPDGTKQIRSLNPFTGRFRAGVFDLGTT